ncbi:hypothetical protein [Geodermatophilus sp. CPCC 205506]|uniref:hypothetical protein n=1 Tax=Geodermatophilus sp. CPCC 205506 TaxID=2936596 RepID=UPI003EEE2449
MIAAPERSGGSSRKLIVNELVRGREDYLKGASPYYDQALAEVASRADRDRSLGKVDLGGLLLWKRLGDYRKWALPLNRMSDEEVRQITGEALEAARDDASGTPEAAARGRERLRLLPGCVQGTGAWPSTILLAAAPQRMAVYDRRAHIGLKKLGYQVGDRISYGPYMAAIEALRDMVADSGRIWLARDVDLALYQLGGPST